jgi:hypothetical protein
MEKPLNRPPELLRQADAIFAALVANPEIPEPGRGYGLRFGISPLGAVLLADRHGKQANEPPEIWLNSIAETHRSEMSLALR